MKVALIADTHLANHRRWGGPVTDGLNVRGWHAVDCLRRAVAQSEHAGCQVLFILGDLFDSSRPPPPLVAATIEALTSTRVEVYVLLGNHDMQSPGRLDHAAASMAYTSGINIVRETTVVRYGELTIGMIPYQPGLASEWLPGEMAKMTGGGTQRVDLALSHIGIWDDETPAFMKVARDAVGLGQLRFLCEAHGVKAFAAGNWHHARHWQTRARPPEVLIPGTLIPHTFSDAGTSDTVGRLWTYDNSCGFIHHATITGPRFATLTLSQFLKQLGPELLGPWYVRVRCAPEELEAALAARRPGVNVDIEVIKPETVAEAAVAAIAASEGDLTEAYSELAAVESPGTREGVQRRLEAYRKGVG